MEQRLCKCSRDNRTEKLFSNIWPGCKFNCIKSDARIVDNRPASFAFLSTFSWIFAVFVTYVTAESRAHVNYESIVIMRYRGTHICIVPPLSRLLPFFILHILGARDLHSRRCGYWHRELIGSKLNKVSWDFSKQRVSNAFVPTNVLLRFLSSSLSLSLSFSMKTRRCKTQVSGEQMFAM